MHGKTVLVQAFAGAKGKTAEPRQNLSRVIVDGDASSACYQYSSPSILSGGYHQAAKEKVAKRSITFLETSKAVTVNQAPALRNKLCISSQSRCCVAYASSAHLRCSATEEATSTRRS